jgi:LytTr DNA-binding domain
METEKILVGSRKKYTPEEIIYLKSDQNYTNVFLSNGNKVLVSTTLKIIEDRFVGCGFLRVHRSTVVNMSFVKTYIDKELSGELILSNNNKIPVSRRKNEKLRHLNLNIMKKISILCFCLLTSFFGFAQHSVLISPTGTEALKFNNTVTEKITLYDNGPASKYGMGISFAQFKFYVATTTDDFLFGVGSNTTFAEKFRVKGNGVLQTKNRIQLFDAGGGESAGLWFNSNGNTGFNTFVGIDPSNQFGIYSPILFKNIFSANMANGGIRLEGPSVSSPAVPTLSLGGFGKVEVDRPGIIGGRMTILENGNVGIGEVSPAGALTVSRTGGGYSLFQSPVSGNTNGDGVLVGMGSSGDAYLYHYENSDVIFGTANSEKMRIKGNGNIGIGTSTPSNQLTIHEDLFGGQIKFQNNASGNTVTDGFTVGMGAAQTAMLFNAENTDMNFATNNTFRMRLTAAGNLEFIGAGKITQEAFTNLSLQNSWVHFGGLAVPAFYKDKEGRVHLKGGLAPGTTGTNTLIAVLPVGYRPSETVVFRIYNFGSTDSSIIINSAGEIRQYTGTITFNLATFDGISFRVD